jgi:hypothetical protein
LLLTAGTCKHILGKRESGCHRHYHPTFRGKARAAIHHHRPPNACARAAHARKHCTHAHHSRTCTQHCFLSCHAARRCDVLHLLTSFGTHAIRRTLQDGTGGLECAADREVLLESWTLELSPLFSIQMARSKKVRLRFSSHSSLLLVAALLLFCLHPLPRVPWHAQCHSI